MKRTHGQTVNELLDYGWNYAPEFGDDPLVASTFTAPAGITLASQSHDDTQTVVWVDTRNAVEGETYTISNIATSQAGRKAERHMDIKIVSRRYQ